jgi:sulfur carrier protein ThiS
MPLFHEIKDREIVLNFQEKNITLKKIIEELSQKYGNWLIDYLMDNEKEYLNRNLVIIINGNLLDYRKKIDEYIIKEDTDISILTIIDGG